MEEQALKRFTVEVDADHQQMLSGLAKSAKVSQGDVITALLDHCDKDVVLSVLREVKARKAAVDGRSNNGSLVRRLNALDPVKRAAIEAILAGEE